LELILNRKFDVLIVNTSTVNENTLSCLFSLAIFQNFING
jgi:hypothetical protein